MANVTSPASQMVANSSYLDPLNIVMALPRAFQRAGAFAVTYLPDQLEDLLSMARQPGTVIADATSKNQLQKASLTATTILPSITAVPSTVHIFHGWLGDFAKKLGIDHVNSLDGVFGYFASRWAVSTVTIAIVLNRARVYSSARRRLQLNWYTRLLLRIVPILLFVNQIRMVLQTMHCQTGLHLSAIDETNGKAWNGAFAGEQGPLHWISSKALWWQDEATSCARAGMLRSGGKAAAGSSSVLWPMFLILCLSHLMETISCALEGRPPVPETAMTLFEHSLAFAEAEAVVRNSIGLGLFGPLKKAKEIDGQILSLKRSEVLYYLNVPPEVLLIALISSCSHFSNHALGVLGLQSKCRLVNTSIWGLSFMAAFVWSFIRFASSVNDGEVGVLRYPTVCIVGFIPHIVILVSIAVCASIYLLALSVTVLSPPTASFMRTTWIERIRMANDNLQATTALAPMTIRWCDEFYTTLLKIGFNVLTAASEAVYFNEGISVAMARSTWLENSRFEGLARSEKRRLVVSKRTEVPPELSIDEDIAEGLNLVDANGEAVPEGVFASGYGKERTTAKASNGLGQAATREEGVGGAQRSSRWYMSYVLMQQDALLLGRLMAKGVIYALRKVSPSCVTQSMVAFANPVELQTAEVERTFAEKTVRQMQQYADIKPFWLRTERGRQYRPEVGKLDVETALRDRALQSASPTKLSNESALEAHLYDWWKQGGEWGDVDASGAYQPDVFDDEDLTSVISEAESSINSGLHSDDELSDGRRTPTQRHPYTFSRESTPLHEDMLSDFSRLLDPSTQEEKQEARLLSSRLRRRGPTTRAQYARERRQQDLRLLSGRGDLDPDLPMTPDQEEELFEKIIMSRRREAHLKSGTPASTNAQGQSWIEGGEGLGSDGPQCVVCHSSPRTILLWPCRCLCLCEDCRVTMAMHNFGTCVTCRRDVVAFSRLFVP